MRSATSTVRKVFGWWVPRPLPMGGSPATKVLLPAALGAVRACTWLSMELAGRKPPPRVSSAVQHFHERAETLGPALERPRIKSRCSDIRSVLSPPVGAGLCGLHLRFLSFCAGG